MKVYQQEKEPTCTEMGHPLTYKCSLCNEYYLENVTTSLANVNINRIEIAAKGHKYTGMDQPNPLTHTLISEATCT